MREINRWMPLEARMAMVLLCSIMQLFVINVHGSYIALALPIAALLLPEVVKNTRYLLRQRVVIISLLLVLTQCVSLAWAIDLQEGIRTVLYTFYFILMLCAGMLIDRKKLLNTPAMVGVWISLAIVAILVIAFRVSPVLESRFWHTALSDLLMNNNVVNGLLDGTHKNNVLDPNKAGGVFANGNVASNYLIMSLFFAMSCLRRCWATMVLCGLMIVAIYATGSKAGVLLVNGVLLLALLVCVLKRWRMTARHAAGIFAIGVLSACYFYAPVLQLSDPLAPDHPVAHQELDDTRPSEEGSSPLLSREETGQSLESATTPSSNDPDRYAEKEKPLSFSQQLLRTMGSRGVIWEYGLTSLSHHWLKGHGFGGWTPSFASYVDSLPNHLWGVNRGMPPHDTLLLVWSQSGGIALIIAITFIIYCIVLSLRPVIGRGKMEERYARALLCCAAAILALLVQGMGENWGVLGEPHQTALFALCLGYLATYASPKQRYDRQDFIE